jgi:outer membrane murein-binding lipoprotein Lpp
MTTKLKANAGFTAMFRRIFKPRDVFLHDGKSLRRFTIGAGVQMAAVMAAFVVLSWSTFATFRAIDAMNGDVAQLERQVAQMQSDVAAMRTATVQRAALLERRQTFLAAMLSGRADEGQLAAMLPEAAQAPDSAAEQAASRSFQRVDGMQAVIADQARAAARERYREAAGALRRLGLEPGRFHAAAGAVGGPYEPVATVDNADPRFRELFTTWRQLDQLQ